MQRLFVSTAIGALSLMVTGTAHADCDAVTGIAEWQSVTCDSTSVFDGPDAVETRGISAENDDIFVRVTPGAVINTQQSGSSAIDLSDSTGGFVENEGEILAGSQGIQGGSVYVFNSGDIAAVEQAIQANESAAGVYNSQNSTIQSSTNNAIEAEGYVTLENRGAVLGFGGVIQAEGADIENYGLIESTQTVEDLSSGPAIETQDAINLDHGRIYNEGTITSTTGSAIDIGAGVYSTRVLNEFGLISGTIGIATDAENTAQQEVENIFGTIAGTSGTALSLGRGADWLFLVGGSIIGDVDMGQDDDLLTIYNLSEYTLSGANEIYFFGGEGYDTLWLQELPHRPFSEFDIRAQGEDLYSLNYGGESTLFFGGFESIRLNEGEFSFHDFAMSSVPVPGAGFLLLGALGAVAGLKRKKRRLRMLLC
ncbi:hypothetical protein TRM7557_03538 [Tritonibacter multivorans]|uniref:Extracellular repeat, HAF family n=1 Tax=Tritonibacter multivorans TaxID=928856 RepID=A0A0P1GZE5_9RHOB|nr:VPLPA-CTERM sorting domain-containing protein [Tritonibacter multivorans]MDA7420407.1 VPLPA-CTERM sorting domain-containing protein [Tritonibacter multivorans]CUH81667.1 hypothetical protein TRM7557_03538 [Tritonibacter multivorans]SFC40621.1 PEP-CTERM protein-sorting domain-containing protein [Tritonibacter multivorans]